MFDHDPELLDRAEAGVLVVTSPPEDQLICAALRDAGYFVHIAHDDDAAESRLASRQLEPISVAVIRFDRHATGRRVAGRLDVDPCRSEPGDVVVAACDPMNDPPEPDHQHAHWLTDPHDSNELLQAVADALRSSATWRSEASRIHTTRAQMYRRLMPVDASPDLHDALGQLTAAATQCLDITAAAFVSTDGTVDDVASGLRHRPPFADSVPAALMRSLADSTSEQPRVVRGPARPTPRSSTFVFAPLSISGRREGYLMVAIDPHTTSRALSNTTNALQDLLAMSRPQLSEFDWTGLRDHRRFEPDWREVIEAKAFQPVFEPIHDLATLQPAGYAARVRFQNGKRPELALRAATRQGVGRELLDAMVRRRIDAASELENDGFLLVLVSSEWASGPDSIESLPDDRNLVLALTERELLLRPDRMRSALERITDSPHRGAIVDVGWGQPDRSPLTTCPPAMFGLASSLVADLDERPIAQSLIVDIASTAARHGTTVIAQGLHDLDELPMLVSLGVHLGQGLLVGEERVAHEINQAPLELEP